MNKKSIIKKIKEMKKELKGLENEVYGDEGCYNSACPDMCMHKAIEEEHWSCNNEGCRHHSSNFNSNHSGNCRKTFEAYRKVATHDVEAQKRAERAVVLKCCGFRKKHMPCKCPCY